MNFYTLTEHNFEMPKLNAIKIGSFVGMFELSSQDCETISKLQRRKKDNKIDSVYALV